MMTVTNSLSDSSRTALPPTVAAIAGFAKVPRSAIVSVVSDTAMSGKSGLPTSLYILPFASRRRRRTASNPPLSA